MAAEIDVAPELLEKVTNAFRKGVDENKNIRAAAARITAGRGGFPQAERIAQEIGKELTAACERYLTAESLPNGRLYYNIADRVIRPNLEEGYMDTQMFTGQVVDQVNSRAGIGMRAAYQDMDEARIQGIIDAVSAQETIEEAFRYLREPLVNLFQSAVTGMAEHNARVQYDSGMAPQIVRTAEGGACKWCQDLAGTYDYPLRNSGVVERHEYCRCTIEFVPAKKRRSDEWVKNWVTDEELEERGIFGL